MRGRETDHAKRHLILDTAAKFFPENGYEATPLEAIASLADVSKVTVYKYFGTKHGLYLEAMTRWLPNLRCEIKVSDASPKPTDGLIDFGIKMHEMISAPTFVNAERRFAISQYHCPKLGEAFLSSTWSTIHAALVELLTELRDTRHIFAPDTSFAAEQLLSMFRGMGDLERRFGHERRQGNDQEADNRCDTDFSDGLWFSLV